MRIVVAILVAAAAAAAAQAQPVIGPEIIWRTTSLAAPYKPAPQAARIVADGAGFVVGWSEVAGDVSRACAGTLDHGGRLTAVGVCTAGTAGAVSVAPFGDRYLAAWLEPELGDARTRLVTAALDRHFALLGAHVVDLVSGTPVVRAGARAFVASGSLLYELDGDGAITNAYPSAPNIDDLAVVKDEVGFVRHTLTHTLPVCGFFRCSAPFDVYALSFTWLFRITVGDSWRFTSDAPAGIGTTGSEFLVVNFDPTAGGARALLWGPAVRTVLLPGRIPSALDALAQPQIAWDGARWLVVWSSDAGVQGVALTPDLVATPIIVNARGSRPAVASARNGRFLVTYEIVEAGPRRLVSRTIDFEPAPQGRGRAVR